MSPHAPVLHPASSSPPRARRPSTTDKSSLLSALASELKTSKALSEAAAQEMVHFEHLIEQKHTAFLSEQDSLIARRERKNAEIASLRKRLGGLKRELEEAMNVREEEAQAYLELIQSGGGGRDALGRAEVEEEEERGIYVSPTVERSRAQDVRGMTGTAEPRLQEHHALDLNQASSNEWYEGQGEEDKNSKNWAGKVLTTLKLRRRSSTNDEAPLQ
ncbi:uncharacterized protein JCM6883_001298 [Sporobolomyces salmoneus]|uniref:uncharacterized protein n=1 Tax=Sporobolomyces salmoneus TaxID=183962 RepID=UPI0031827A33